MLTFAIVVIGWIFSLCLHEFSHAMIAYLGGDTSVKDKGYLTFNPLKYTHPVMSLVIPLIFVLLGGIGLPGGAVYIDRSKLESKHWESAVAAAGPVSNIIFALILGIVLRYAGGLLGDGYPGVSLLAQLQVAAVVLNLLPLPPLDGFGIIAPYINPATRRIASQMGGLTITFLFMALWILPPVNQAYWATVDSIGSRIGIDSYWAYEGWRQMPRLNRT